MTVVSLTDACHCLGIDAKTLHRWLEDAQLFFQDHPRDGRKKGISREHLNLLAHLHHRSLVLPPQVSPATPQHELPPLPVALLALPETLASLQVQIAALQQQVAALTHLLQQQTCPQAPAKRTAPPIPTVARSQPIAPTKRPPKPTPVIPRVEYGTEGRYVVVCPKRGLLPFEPDTPDWFAWVAKQSSFRFVGKAGHFTAHHEGTSPRGAWRAHRHIRNQSYTLPLAPNRNLSIAVLEQATQALQAHLA